MKIRIITILALCAALAASCDRDSGTAREEKGKQVDFVMTRGVTNRYADDTTFGFIAYEGTATEPAYTDDYYTYASLATYIYNKDKSKDLYGVAGHLVPWKTDDKGDPIATTLNDIAGMGLRLDDVNFNSNENNIWMYTPGIFPVNNGGSWRVKYTRDIELQAATEPFIVEMDNYDGVHTVNLSSTAKMETQQARFIFNFIQGTDTQFTIDIDKVKLYNVGTTAYFHPKTRNNQIAGQGTETDADRKVVMETTGLTGKDKTVYKTTSHYPVFPGNYLGNTPTGLKSMSLEFELTINTKKSVVLLPLAMEVLANKQYTFNINITSEMITFSYNYTNGWNSENNSSEIGGITGQPIVLGTFNIGDWDNGNGENQEDDIL